MKDLENIPEEEHEVDTIMLEFEDGAEVECIIRAVIELDGKHYVALLPMGENEYLVYGYEEVGEEIKIINIEDEELYQKVVENFDEYFYNEEDDEEYDEDEDYEEDEEEEEE